MRYRRVRIHSISNSNRHFLAALGWTVYSILLSDHWIFWANFPGAIGGGFLTLRGYAMASKDQQLFMERTLLSVLVVFFLASWHRHDEEPEPHCTGRDDGGHHQ
jgi:hypothetical protein